MLTYHRAFIRLCAVILAITITPYCCWQVISTVVASQADTMAMPVTNNTSTTKTDGTSVIAPLLDQTAGATLMYDGTLMYTEYCRDLYNTHQQLRQSIAE